MKKNDIPNNTFSDEGEMTLEQTKILLDFIMKHQRDTDTNEQPELKFPAQYVETQNGILPPNLRCMGTSAKAMRENIIRECKGTAFLLHKSKINASKALPPM